MMKIFPILILRPLVENRNIILRLIPIGTRVISMVILWLLLIAAMLIIKKPTSKPFI